MEHMVNLIGTVGFPIAACLVMGLFIFKIYKNTTAENAKNMETVQSRCAAREERLYSQIAECQRINSEAIATITLYAERIGNIENDLKDIKSEVDSIANKL